MKLLALLILLNGCATPYQPYKTFHGGYKDQKISENTYSVSFEGNGLTSADEAEAYAVKRANEICGGKFEPLSLNSGNAVEGMHRPKTTLLIRCSSATVN